MHPRARRTTPRLLVGFAVAAILLAACGDDSGPDVSASTTSPASDERRGGAGSGSGADSTPTTSARSGGGGSAAKVCNAITVAELEAATGGRYSAVQVDGSRCAWNLTTNTGNVTIDVGMPPTAALAVGSKTVAGIGDEAKCTCTKLLGILGFVKGGTGYVVQVSGVADSAAGVERVATLVVAEL